MKHIFSENTYYFPERVPCCEKGKKKLATIRRTLWAKPPPPATPAQSQMSLGSHLPGTMTWGGPVEPFAMIRGVKVTWEL